jgi:MerR family transcriptional regulator, mercuric resistance operon regulatory protein
VTISQLAKSAGVKAETVRYYQRIGLLRTPKRPRRGFRVYDDADASHLRFVRQAQKVGFTLEEIAILVRLSSADCEEVERLARERLSAVQMKIGELRRLEAALKSTLSECERRQAAAGCPLIEALLGASADSGE